MKYSHKNNKRMPNVELKLVNKNITSRMTPLLRQAWAVSAVLMNAFGQGMVLGYPSSLLPALNSPNSPIKVDLHSSSWLGSIVGLAGIPGFLISSVSMTLYGRRITHGLLILPGIVGWLLIYFGESVSMLMVGRFLGGLSACGTVFVGAVVIGEYTCPKYRGVFLCLKNAGICLGAMLIHVSGSLDWKTVALIGLVPLMVALSVIFTWPESPAWLASKHQYQSSMEAFYWLRGNSEDSRREIEHVVKAQKAKMSELKIKSTNRDIVRHFWKKLTQKHFLKPIFIMMLAMAITELSGRHIFQSYALRIMTDITGETAHAYYYILAIDIIITVSAMVASVLVRIMNRRTLLFSTGLTASVVLMFVSLYLFLASKNIIPNDKPWFPIGFLVLYFILANLGCAPIPLALIGEVFPVSHRGIGTAFSGMWFSMCILGGLESAPYLLVSIKVYGFFAVYGGTMGLCLLILYFILPETKDKTLQEIENYFNFGEYTNSDGDEEANTKIIKQ